MLLKDQIKIKDDLMNDKITWDVALEKLKADKKGQGKDRWHTEEWKKLRSKLIKNCCEQCESVEPPFSLLHLSQPQTFKRLCSFYSDPYFEDFKLKNPIDVPPIEKLMEEREVCPKCESVSIIIRKTHEFKYVCRGKKLGRSCNHVFDTPNKTIVEARRKNTELNQQRWAKVVHLGDIRWKQFEETFKPLYMKKAIIHSIEDTERYLSGNETATFCKKCAYMWNKNRKNLCPKCKKNYKGFDLDFCTSCDDVNYKICEKCGKTRHRVNFEMCYDCFAGGNY